MSRELEKYSDRYRHLIVHTGQHYDKNMSKIFFDQLDIPMPNINLGVGAGNHGEQTGKIMIEFEKICLEEKPDIVLIYGDVNSTIAAALVSVKLGIRIGHVEAGLRSFDRAMPEEINRILTDTISDYLFTPSPDADENLIKEGIPQEKIHMVGDIMVDSLLFNKGKAAKLDVLSTLDLSAKKYAVLTLHRPNNVDNEQNMKNIFSALNVISEKVQIVFPMHPRTKKMMQKFSIKMAENIKTIQPLGYLEFLSLMTNCKFMLTDSGGIQEETTVLDVPCLTLRNTTERPITLSHGTNILVWNDTEKIVREVDKILNGRGKKGKCPDLWDGQTAKRIIDILQNLFDK